MNLHVTSYKHLSALIKVNKGGTSYIETSVTIVTHVKV